MSGCMPSCASTRPAGEPARGFCGVLVETYILSEAGCHCSRQVVGSCISIGACRPSTCGQRHATTLPLLLAIQKVSIETVRAAAAPVAAAGLQHGIDAMRRVRVNSAYSWALAGISGGRTSGVCARELRLS